MSNVVAGLLLVAQLVTVPPAAVFCIARAVRCDGQGRWAESDRWASRLWLLLAVSIVFTLAIAFVTVSAA